jgi:hypothetical protein
MDEVAGPIRDASRFKSTLDVFGDALYDFNKNVKVKDQNRLWLAYRLRDALIGEMAYIWAMLLYTNEGGKSRGSAIYTSENGTAPEKLEDVFRFELDDGSLNDTIFEITYKNGSFKGDSRPVRPLPEGGGFFENVWREYRENKNIY